MIPNEEAMRALLGEIGEFGRPLSPNTTNEVIGTNIVPADSASPSKL